MRSFIAKALYVIVVLPSIALLLWFALAFLPHLGEPKVLSAAGIRQTIPVAGALYPYAVASESKSRIRAYAISRAYSWLVVRKEPERAIFWHANNVLWYLASLFCFDDREVFGLWISCAWSGCGQGLPKAAHTYYGKGMEELTQRELAGLVALARNPAAFGAGTARYEKQVDSIIEAAKLVRSR